MEEEEANKDVGDDEDQLQGLIRALLGPFSLF